MLELRTELHALHQCLSSLELDVRELVFEPPATEAEVLGTERTIGISLPPGFRNTLLTVSKHVEFSWFIPRERQFREPFDAIFCGDMHWSLDLVESLQDGRAEGIASLFPDPENSYDAVWHNTLAFFEVGNGDEIAIDLLPQTYGRIVYLSHDGGEGHGYTLANDFPDLIERWAPLACPGGEDWQWLPFTNGKTTPIDPNCANGCAWRNLLGLV